MARSIPARRLRVAIRQLRRFVIHRVLHADDPPRKLAIGAAAGMFVAFTPTIGVQMPVAALVAWVLRGNKALAAAMVWISNPLTLIPIYYPCYWLGAKLTGQRPVHWSWWQDLVNPPPGTLIETLRYFWGHVMEVAVPMWIGCILVATVLAMASYFVVDRGISAYRLRRWGQLTPPLIGAPHRLKHFHHEPEQTGEAPRVAPGPTAGPDRTAGGKPQRNPTRS